MGIEGRKKLEGGLIERRTQQRVRVMVEERRAGGGVDVEGKKVIKWM